MVRATHVCAQPVYVSSHVCFHLSVPEKCEPVTVTILDPVVLVPWLLEGFDVVNSLCYGD
jgi:hypothetical protein